MEIVVKILETLVNFVQSTGPYGVVVACGLIFVESILPMMPLSVFITVNFLILGKCVGFFVSWIFTVLGCSMSYSIFKKGFGNKFDNLTENKKLIKKYKKLFKDISLGKLILIIAMPFTPAFVVNIVAGLTKMDFKKYFIGLLIGKIAMVYFWGFIGTSLIESLKNPMILIKIVIIMLGTYAIYFILNKIFKFE
ncbi:MAG: TVP38/TMEM64 family protein [Bacilli bacterium]|nr:TVP38/TMEM64 family protein [Bacilli bacterium]